MAELGTAAAIGLWGPSGGFEAGCIEAFGWAAMINCTSTMASRV
jgi:hypothetical protein